MTAKEVEVEVGGHWYYGELRSSDQADDGSWSGIVSLTSRANRDSDRPLPGRANSASLTGLTA